MKKTNCKNLRGSCDYEITGSTPEEMGEKSKQHVMRMVAEGDAAHKVAIESMMKLSSDQQRKWYQDFASSFDSLPNA